MEAVQRFRVTPLAALPALRAHKEKSKKAGNFSFCMPHRNFHGGIACGAWRHLLSAGVTAGITKVTGRSSTML
ncbi:hypothetical protein [Amycolatopsis sp. NPDC059021]|uniref:hypothetical protein n=1 Tax=Amycolatopsis sp. NPDC059021 TaxID=3346704 RepID=UPI00366FA2D9